MKIVLDTNVLVAGLLTPFGTCGEIVRMVTSGNLTLCMDARILFEYDDILHRPCFDIEPENADAVLEYIRNTDLPCSTTPLPIELPDPDDSPFLEVAIAGKAECLVTGNLKHYPPRCRQGVPVLSPSEFIEYYKKAS